MLHPIAIFLVSSVVSFIGSLQLGPVNLFVINSVLQKSRKIAFWIALGGCLPEFIYCTLAVYSHQFIPKSPTFDLVFKGLFILVLFLIGISYFVKKQVNITVNFFNEETAGQNVLKPILKGFSLALFNPQLLPFWLFILLSFNSTQLLNIKTKIDEFSFIFGAGIGAFILLLFIIFIVSKYKLKILKYSQHKYYFKSLALLFFLLAIQQIISFVI